MNIFKILSSYDGTINEPNISAVLAYLLNPMEDHGIGYHFLNQIVKILSDKNGNDSALENYLKNYNNFEVEISPEYSVNVQKISSTKKRDIDILIRYYYWVEDGEKTSKKLFDLRKEEYENTI